MLVLVFLIFVVLLVIAGFVAKIAESKRASIALFVIAGLSFAVDIFTGFFTGLPKH